MSPAGTGTVDVTVTTPGGKSATSAADQFSYVAAPVVTGLSPTFGPAAGGTLVTITGTEFTGAAAVDFGTTAGTNLTVVSDSSITVDSPAGTGTVDVTVTATGGTSAIVAADQFTYAPTVTGLSPTSGLAAGGTLVTITGTGFTGATIVDFGTTPGTNLTVISDTSLTVDSPAGSGTVDVTVTTPSGTSAITAADRFAYAGIPAVTGLSPITDPRPAAPWSRSSGQALLRDGSRLRPQPIDEFHGGERYLDHRHEPRGHQRRRCACNDAWRHFADLAPR